MNTSNDKLQIEWLSLESLTVYDNNPKEHPPEQVAQIAASIKAFGFNDPIAVDAENVIIEGHGRLLAAQKLGLEQVPVIQLGHLSEAQKKAYALAHNKLTLNTGWDLEKLQVELELLESLEFEDLSLTGFSLKELEGFAMAGDPDAQAGEGEAAEPTEVSIKYQCQYGVIIVCETEDRQQKVYTELTEAGYDCKVVVT